MGRHADGSAPAPGPAPGPRPAERPTAPGGGSVTPPGLLGWGLFATAVAVGLAVLAGYGWPSALPVGGLGAGASLILWAASRTAGSPATQDTQQTREPREGRARRGHRAADATPHGARGRRTRVAHDGHATESGRLRSVKWPRDQRKR